jgi:tetratricopeptide (TPR) repeat protein
MYDPVLDPIFYAYEENFADDPDLHISFYETNAYVFSATRNFDAQRLFKYEAIAGNYLGALLVKKQYKKVAEQSGVILDIIERDLVHLKIDPAEDTCYKHILFNSAYAKFYRMTYLSAYRDLKKLVAYDPDNPVIKMWLDVAKYRYYEYALLFVSLIIVGGFSFYKPYLPLSGRIIILTGGVVFGFTALWFEYLARKTWKAKNALKP